MLVSGPREAPSFFGVLFSETGSFCFSFGLGRRSFQAVFRTFGSKSCAARSESVGLLRVDIVGPEICFCSFCKGAVALFREESDAVLLMTDG